MEEMSTSTIVESSAPAASLAESPQGISYADIGINLTDPVFHGVYHGKTQHETDLPAILSRAASVGVRKLMVTGSDLSESRRALGLAREHPNVCFATVGVHPCNAKSFESEEGPGPEEIVRQLKELAMEGRNNGSVVAFGEIGLDYDRLFLSGMDVQKRWFERQLDLAVEVGLPLFLHSRAAAEDFESLLKSRLPNLPKGGLVHSFTGSLEEMKGLVALGLDVGVNGCSLKTEENLEVVKEIPLERMQIETDGPWCEIRATHAGSKFLTEEHGWTKRDWKWVKKEKWSQGSLVKGRNEPCMIEAVAHIVAKVKGVSVEEVAQKCWINSVKMFQLGEKET